MTHQTLVFAEIPFTAEVEDLDKNGLFEEDLQSEEVIEILKTAIGMARPKAVVLPVDVVHDEEGKVLSVGGQTMDSVILDKNLKDLHRGFLFVATCGQELEEFAQNISRDDNTWYLLYQLRLLALGAARNHMLEQVKQRFDIPKLAAMNPGSLPEWPITEQKKVFAILGEDAEKIGVKLGDNMFMMPLENSSGLLFETEKAYQNCMICTRLDCVGRHAPYDPELAEKFRGGIQVS